MPVSIHSVYRRGFRSPILTFLPFFQSSILPLFFLFCRMGFQSRFLHSSILPLFHPPSFFLFCSMGFRSPILHFFHSSILPLFFLFCRMGFQSPILPFLPFFHSSILIEQRNKLSANPNTTRLHSLLSLRFSSPIEITREGMCQC